MTAAADEVRALLFQASEDLKISEPSPQILQITSTLRSSIPDDKVLCLCYSCAPSTWEYVLRAQQPRAGHSVSKRTVARHFTLQRTCGNEVQEEAAKLACRPHAAVGVRFLDKSYFLQLVEVILKAKADQESEEGSACYFDQAATPARPTAGTSHASSLGQSAASTSSLWSPLNHSPIAQAGRDEDAVSLPTYVYTSDGLVGQWGKWPDLLGSCSSEEKKQILVEFLPENDGAEQRVHKLPTDLQELLAGEFLCFQADMNRSPYLHSFCLHLLYKVTILFYTPSPGLNIALALCLSSI